MSIFLNIMLIIKSSILGNYWMNHDNSSQIYFSKQPNFSQERRTFLKLNVALLGRKLLPSIKQNSLILRERDRYDLFDLLQSIDFSKVVKKEIWLRIRLHKKYGYDANAESVL